MKRGKDDDKNMGPMFPRLHVNDTEKGGPRAPPRNKMALYEQLSIPSQRFNNHGVLPLNPKSSSSQGGVSERGSVFPLQQPFLMHTIDKTNNRFSDLNNQTVHQEQKKKHEEDDFRVPIFFQQSGLSLNLNENQQNGDNFSGRVTNIQKSASNQPSRQTIKDQLKETDGSLRFGLINASNNSIRLQNNVNLRDQVVDSRNIEEQEVIRSPNDHVNGDAVSETSMVDSMSGVDISPDDVVGIIGQKHFWKARRAIVNQQRLFAVQVFELHRLIKVQRLIAGSPQIMVDHDAFLGKPAKISSPIKKIPLEYVLETSPNVPKIKDYSEKPNENRREFSAENAIEKASISSVQNTFSGGLSPPLGSWSLNHQTPGHQWLIPVMSPSEGLVYKPYPGPPGHNFVNYGVPPPPHQQWPAGYHPLVAPTAHGYFPPYSALPVNPSSNNDHNNTSYDNNIPILAKFHASKESEVQVRTASSTSDRAQDQNPLPLFPTCPTDEVGPQPTRAIRVVPHNARLATESVARIFQSIQEERKQDDSG